MNHKAARRQSFDNEVLPFLEPLWQTALWLTRNENEAFRLVQDLFAIVFRLWMHWNNFRNTKSWMFKVLVRLYYNRFHEDTHTGVSISDGYISESIIGDEVLSGIFAELPEEIRLVLVLSLVGGFSYIEIADIIGTKIEIVQSHIRRGYATLKDEIAKFVYADSR